MSVLDKPKEFDPVWCQGKCGCSKVDDCRHKCCRLVSSNRALFREIEKVLAAQQEKAATAPPTAPPLDSRRCAACGHAAFVHAGGHCVAAGGPVCQPHAFAPEEVPDA